MATRKKTKGRGVRASAETIRREAERVVDAAGQAGGIDEVRRLAKFGWPRNRPLDNDSAALRRAIQDVARAEIRKDTAEAPRGHRDPVDEHAATELVLYIENTSELSPDGPSGQGRSVLLNALRKWRKGTYDPALGVKLFEYLAEAGAKSYSKEYGPTTFNPATRHEAARQLEMSFRHSVEHGEYDHIPTGHGAREAPGVEAPRGRAIQVGDKVRFTSKYLKNTGQYTGHDANGRWEVLEIRGSFVFVNQPSDTSYFTPAELQTDPMLKWRAINVGNLEIA